MSTLPLTYTDLLCNDDVDAFGLETTSDLQNLIQDVYHVLKELPGTNPDDPTRGVGVDFYLNGTQDKLVGLAGVIEGQLNKDDRITGVSCAINQNADASFTFAINISVSGDVIPLQFTWTATNGLTYATV